MVATSNSTPALVSTAPNVARLATVGRAPLGPEDVLIRTIYSGVSTGTDKWVLTGLFEWIPLDFPLVSGYQRSGVVIDGRRCSARRRSRADMEFIQKREYTAHFVSGWRRDRLLAVLDLMRSGSFPVETLVGLIAADERSIAALADATISGSVAPTAAAIDWRALQP